MGLLKLMLCLGHVKDACLIGIQVQMLGGKVGYKSKAQGQLGTGYINSGVINQQMLLKAMETHYEHSESQGENNF